jgi:FAD/FMN-containing dehydrogenase
VSTIAPRCQAVEPFIPVEAERHADCTHPITGRCALDVRSARFERTRMNIEQLIGRDGVKTERWLRPNQPEYDAARRVWNGLIDRRPAVIARCRGARDVADTLRVARRLGVPVSVRAGGHNVAGTAVVEGGVMIDLRELDEVSVDADRRLVRAGGGCTFGKLDAAMQAAGLATPGGVFSRTGIAGLTLSGGYGWLSTRFGLACDNLMGAELVTAEGAFLRLPDDDPTLLWGLRGGGGNFGVVTTLEYRAHPLDHEVQKLAVMYPIDRGLEILRFVRDYMLAAPDELAVIAVYATTPDDHELPASARDQHVIGLIGCFSGDPDVGARVVAPLRELGSPVIDMSERVPYVAMQQFFDADYPDGRCYYWKSTHLDSMSDEVMEAAHEHGIGRSSRLSSLDLWFVAGQVLRTDRLHSPMRRARYLAGIEANWDDPAESSRHIEWARSTWRDLSRFGSGTYLNFAGFGEEREALVRSAFGASFDDLRRLKQRYDPANVFRSNMNIPP